MPIQRLPRYILLLKDLLDSTPEGHDDHKDLYSTHIIFLKNQGRGSKEASCGGRLLE